MASINSSLSTFAGRNAFAVGSPVVSPTAVVASASVQPSAVLAATPSLASSTQLSLASSLGIPQEFAACISPPKQVMVPHTNHTVHQQTTTRRWLTNTSTWNPAQETLSAALQVEQPLTINQPCTTASCPTAAAVVAAAPSCGCGSGY